MIFQDLTLSLFYRKRDMIMAYDDEDIIGSLIAAGVLLALGCGLYRFIKSFGEYEEGDKINSTQLANSLLPHSNVQLQDEKKDYCPDCNTTNPDRCWTCGDCLTCHGDYCGQCLLCCD